VAQEEAVNELSTDRASQDKDAAAGSVASRPRRRPWHPPSPLAFASIRTRILVGFVALLAVATVASIVIARQVLNARFDERIQGELQQEVAELRKMSSGVDPATGQPYGTHVRRLFTAFFNANAWSDGEAALTFVAGKPFLRSPAVDPAYRLDRDAKLMARWEGIKEPQSGSIDTAAGSVDYLAVPVKANGQVLGTFVAAQFRDLQQGPFNDALLATAAVGLAVLLVGSLLAWAMAESVLRPVKSLTDTARTITESDWTQRIEVRGRDEIAALAETFNAMLDRLEHAFSSQRRFLDDAGHELRTPITIIRGHLELLEDDPEERQATLTLVLDELDRMSRMVNELILLAKAERPDFLRPEAVDLAFLTQDLVAKASALAPRSWVIDGEAKGVIIADRQRLTEALMQLAQNAAEHTREGETIALGSAVDDGEVRFWVRDEGPGIAPADQANIFDRFERRGSRRTDGGAGLGLAIVKAIAEAHDGHVELESELGRGALFAVVLPVGGPPRVKRPQ
jgi:two-component system, OmpR family, sensor kinase